MQLQITNRYTVTHERSAKVILDEHEADLVRRLIIGTFERTLPVGLDVNETLELVRIATQLEAINE